MSQSRKEPMMPTLKGSCLCGAVRYELDQPEAPDGSCGCLVCREANVLAFIGNVGIARSQFRWTAGEVGLSTYDIAPGIRRRLCATCSSLLVDDLLASRLVAVRVATLDRGIEEADQECILHRMRQTPSKAPKGLVIWFLAHVLRRNRRPACALKPEIDSKEASGCGRDPS